jgi:antitoxin component of RelBE/YafQ-DinJ toxin-antitoxin module
VGTTNFTVSLDDADRAKAGEVFEGFGLSMSDGTNIYVKAVARFRKIPLAHSLDAEPRSIISDGRLQASRDEKEKSAKALIGLLVGHEVDLDREREERILG